jgi:hypothetical protein
MENKTYENMWRSFHHTDSVDRETFVQKLQQTR